MKNKNVDIFKIYQENHLNPSKKTKDFDCKIRSKTPILTHRNVIY